LKTFTIETLSMINLSQVLLYLNINCG